MGNAWLGGSYPTERRLTMEGRFEEVKGRVKEAAGDATGDEELAAEGKMDQASGAVKDKVGNAVDAVKEALKGDDG
jgi:uncharacterized protein YjbJ (UPF0337 family)